MKKYIAFAQPLNSNGNSVPVSKISTKEDATQWARNYIQKNLNMVAYVCEIFSTVTRPVPVVQVMPFTPESEPEVKDELVMKP